MEAAVVAASAAAATAAKEAAAAAMEAAAAASAAALNAKEATAVAATAGEAAAAAAAQASKKRKFHSINDQEDEPPGSGTVDDQDHINRLPDAVLGSIVSLLHTKEGARTQAISRRWRPLWRSAPLNLVVDYKLECKGQTTIEIIRKILSEHPGPARRFSFWLLVSDCADEIGGWLGSEALDNLQELEITYGRLVADRKTVYLLPSSTFRFAPTLRVAKFHDCNFPNFIVPEFPCLKQLTLDRVTISEDILQGIISGCSALESLELKGNRGIARLCICSQTLKSLGFCADRRNRGVFLQELVIEDAPLLERLLPLDPKYGPPTIWIISAPKLKILGMLSEDIAELHFGTMVFQKMIAVSLTTKVHTMRVLVLDSVGPNLDTVINFIKCFPHLERLYVIFQPLSRPWMVMNNARKYDPLDPIECLELHLQKVVLKNYDGTKSPSIDFANFFVLNAKVLKEMKITLPYQRQHKWFADQHGMLRIKDRASRDAQIELEYGSKVDFTHNKNTHDLSMDDPFDMPSSGCYKCS
ncbi:FBD-associated F-box protein At3g52670 [Lolium perenne]|uniref:FBD-associated F-box protein At3g52670 n=1 Tax=Lolium perenne TaxID=4522 RepID=UPI0021EA9452|nr:putative F-box/FBD/LRR-repeat protein At5g44960 [Lolium perenne]